MYSLHRDYRSKKEKKENSLITKVVRYCLIVVFNKTCCLTGMFFSGTIGVISMLVLSFHEKLHIVFALLSLTAGSAGVAIADVTIDACVAQNSISHPSLAADMQSLCALSSSIGALVGFSISGVSVHHLGPKVST